MPDQIDILFDNANDHEKGPDLKDAPAVPFEFQIGNRLSDQLQQAEGIFPAQSLIAALELMIRPNAHPQFNHPLLIDIYKTVTLLAEHTTNSVMILRITNRINRLRLR